jgi:hypothetical protein
MQPGHAHAATTLNAHSSHTPHARGRRTWVAQRRGRRGHDRGHQAVDLRKRGVLHVQALDGDAVQRGVVQHDDGVGVLREALEREQRVVGLHDHVAGLALVGEHTAVVCVCVCVCVCVRVCACARVRAGVVALVVSGAVQGG